MITLPRRIEGTVVHGDHRGRELGFPTANIPLDDVPDVPAFGIYAGFLDGRPAAISVGVRPTFGEGLVPLVEAHVLDAATDLYGHWVVVELTTFLRPEKRFKSVPDLVAQIQADVDRTRYLLARRPNGSDSRTIEDTDPRSGDDGAQLFPRRPADLSHRSSKAGMP